MIMSQAYKDPVTHLWIDTTQSNIDRYIERYAQPVLRNLPDRDWHYARRDKILYVRDSILDLRSSERPERIEGFGYSLITINEAGIVLKNPYIWESAVLPMMLDYPESRAVIGGTPKGKYDPKRRREYGKHEHLFYELFLRGLNGDYPEYESYQFSTYANTLIAKELIDKLKRDLPSTLIRQEIYGEFIDDDLGSIIKRDYWQYYKRKSQYIRIVHSWDTAFGEGQENDYNVGTVWGETKNGYHLLDFVKIRASFPKVQKEIKRLYDKWKGQFVLIEGHASGDDLISSLRASTKIPIKRMRKTKDKVYYANSVSNIFEAGQVSTPDPSKCSWTYDVIEDCAEFPNGEFDDTVDSVTQALRFMRDSHTDEVIIATG